MGVGVGVAVSGLMPLGPEGRAAVVRSDRVHFPPSPHKPPLCLCSFAKFKFLQPLLLVHGHYSYMRTCYIVQYCYYKSILLSFCQIIFNAYALFSGTTYWNSFMLACWNGVFTVVTVCPRDKWTGSTGGTSPRSRYATPPPPPGPLSYQGSMATSHTYPLP